MSGMKHTRIKKLESGYWHARFGDHQFVQWPIDSTPELQNVFGEPKEALLRWAQAELEVQEALDRDRC